MQVEQYVNKFSDDLHKLLVFLNNVMPTENVQRMLKMYEHLNIVKIMSIFHRNVSKHRNNILSKDYDVFEHKLFIIPELEISIYWNNLPQNHRKTLVDFISRLIICSNVVFEKAKTEINKEDENNSGISVASVAKEVKTIKVGNNNGLLDKIKEYFNFSELNDKLENLNGESLEQVTSCLDDIISPHVSDQKTKEFFNDATKNIINKLKTHDFKKENLLDVVQSISSEMATDMTKKVDTSECDQNQILNTAKSFMNQLGIDEKVSLENMSQSNMTDIATKLLGKMAQGNSGNTTVMAMDLMEKMFGL